ncbi:MAG: hypothetical protein Q8903_05495 [Bacteroidota bacterium]|nr:hypothetical protein [Bacteroidota bacterium]
MIKKILSPRFVTVSLMIFAAALFRILPHPPNFAPVAAMALFGGAYFSSKKLAVIVPLIILVLSDVVLGFHYLVPAVYTGFLLITVTGFMLRNKRSFGRVLAASVFASVSFFVITNYAEWAFGIMYPKTMAGLSACFTMAIPFFQYTLLGDLVFTGAMFGAFELAKLKFPKLAEAK